MNSVRFSVFCIGVTVQASREIWAYFVVGAMVLLMVNVALLINAAIEMLESGGIHVMDSIH